MPPPLPSFQSLPLNSTGPPGNAWGLFGEKDELGMLNLLTEDVVVAAAKEIRSGTRISLDWPLNKPSHPSFGRQAFQHEIHPRGEVGRPVNDDTVTFNTQSSSQWDGFRHYGDLKAKRYFNGRTPADIASSESLGINVWADNGGIVGRGVLLDYAAYAVRHGITLAPFAPTTIPLAALTRVAAEQGVAFRPGDILILRTGFTAAYDTLSPDEQAALARRPAPEFAGVESNKDVLEWLWNNQFAAVAGDAPAFESSPLGQKRPGVDPEAVLHQWLLAGWGMPIGEMFDLERLAEHCRKEGRWSFFLSSVPLKVPGGVASPPNAIAIF